MSLNLFQAKCQSKKIDASTVPSTSFKSSPIIKFKDGSTYQLQSATSAKIVTSDGLDIYVKGPTVAIQSFKVGGGLIDKLKTVAKKVVGVVLDGLGTGGSSCSPTVTVNVTGGTGTGNVTVKNITVNTCTPQ